MKQEEKPPTLTDEVKLTPGGQFDHIGSLRLWEVLGEKKIRIEKI